MDSDDASSAVTTPALAFFGHTFDEALALRDYGEEKSRELAVEVAAHFSVETMRLTNMIAWLLVQRAMHQGELTREEFRDDDSWRLGGAGICLEEPDVDIELLPPYLSDLLRRSERLYSRIARLDSMAAAETR